MTTKCSSNRCNALGHNNFNGLLGGRSVRIHGLNQSSDIAISERVGLETSRIVWMMRHMIGTDRTRELSVPKNSHDLKKAYLALIGVNLSEIVKPAANVAHVDLVDLLSLP